MRNKIRCHGDFHGVKWSDKLGRRGFNPFPAGAGEQSPWKNYHQQLLLEINYKKIKEHARTKQKPDQPKKQSISRSRKPKANSDMTEPSWLPLFVDTRTPAGAVE